MATLISLPDAMREPELFAPWFSGSSWDGWRAVLNGAFALPMTEAERGAFAELAGGREPPRRRVRELWIVAGRRAGKDSIAVPVAVYTTVFTDHKPLLRPGERATALVLACDWSQARIALGYARALFNEVPLLRGLVERETQDGFELNNGAEIVVLANNFRSVRGRSLRA